MTTDDPFDRLVAAWLERDGPQHAPAGLAQAAFASARRAGQRRGLRAAITGPGAWPARRGAFGRPALSPGLRIALVVLVVLATVGASLVVASRLQKPASLHLLGEVELTGSMGQPRWDPRATLLLDGTILVTGAAGDGGSVSAELYDPGEGRFEPAGSMGIGSAPGDVESQVRLADGRVLVIGSTGGQRDGIWPYTRFAVLYDPSTRSFTPTTQTPDRTMDFGNLIGKVLSDGRVRWDGGPETNGTLWYDPATGAFTSVGTAVVEYPAQGEDTPSRVFLDDGRLLLIGYGPGLRAHASIYDPADGSGTDLGVPPLVAGGTLEATVLPDGRVLLLGSSSALFDPATGSFTAIGTALGHLVAWTADGRALLTGNAGGDFLLPGPTNLWTFDPVTNIVTDLGATLPDTCCAAWTSLPDGRLLGVGGWAGDHPSGTALIVR